MPIVLSSLLLSLAAAGEPEPRKVQCVVTTKGTDPFKGPCLIYPGEKGSFTVEAAGRKSFPQASSISLYVVGPDAGEVRGVTKKGVNFRWGSVVRSRRDRACWRGTDFSICVYPRPSIASG